MKLSNIREAFEGLSGTASNINRQLCFAGLGIIWIFNSKSNKIEVPKELYTPAIMFVVSLAIDIIQYLIQTFTWYIFYLYKKFHCKIKEEEESKESEWLNFVPWLLFASKIAFLVIGYIKIYKYLNLKN